MLSSRVVLVRDECEEEKEKSLSVFQEEGSAGLCTRVHRMEMLFGKTAKQSVFVSVFRRRKSDTLTQTHTPTHQILCPFINSMACREQHMSFSLFYDTTMNINTNPLLTLTHTHTLQNTAGFSFPMAEGQTEAALNIRLAPDAEG